MACLSVERVFLAGRSVRIRARTVCPEAVCPACGATSRRVHSGYDRRLLDTAVAGQETLIHLRVRRFVCANAACEKKTFAELVPRLTTRYGRRTNGLTAVLRAVALALGGRARHAGVHRLLADGGNIGNIAVKLGLSRNTVRRFARADDPEELLVNDGTGQRPSILAEHAPYLHERWNSGCTNAALLWQEIRDRGYQGSRRQVRAYLACFRKNAVIPAPAPVPPKPRAVAGWIMTSPDRIATTDRASLATILASSPELAAVTASVRAFAAIMNERRGRDLEKWMTAAIATGEPALRSFVTGLRADQDAVTAALSLPWSSGVVEGHANRIKMLKRQMYGRANPGLLRRRILPAD